MDFQSQCPLRLKRSNSIERRDSDPTSRPQVNMTRSAGTMTMRLAAIECGAIILHEAIGPRGVEKQTSTAPAQPQRAQSQHTTPSGVLRTGTLILNLKCRFLHGDPYVYAETISRQPYAYCLIGTMSADMLSRLDIHSVSGNNGAVNAVGVFHGNVNFRVQGRSSRY
jgi:hypothetical protein